MEKVGASPCAFEKWHNFLVDFAKRIGKPDPEEYINSGKWKARQGGNGVAAASDVKIKFTNCTTEENAKVYQLKRPVDDCLIGLFTPFGRIAPELGRKLINETVVVDIKTNVPIISIQPFSQDGFEYAVKVKTMNVAKHDDLQRMIGYQIKKFNACRKCLKCESLCRFGAISIIGDTYSVSYTHLDRCRRCPFPARSVPGREHPSARPSPGRPRSSGTTSGCSTARRPPRQW